MPSTKPPARVALVLGDSRTPWPPPPSTNATERLAWEADTYSYTVAMAALYAQRWCFDLRIYRFLPRRAHYSSAASLDAKSLSPCAHPTLGGRSAPWCKLLALHDTLSAVTSGGAKKVQTQLYDLAVWVDSDLFFHDTSRSIAALVREFSAGGGRGRAAPSPRVPVAGGGEGQGDGVVAWFPSNWPWEKRLPNSGLIILRNGARARQLLADWWGHPMGWRWNHRHKYEQEPLKLMWPHPHAALLARHDHHTAGAGTSGTGAGAGTGAGTGAGAGGGAAAGPGTGGAGIGTGTGGSSGSGKVAGDDAATSWRHMTDLVYARGPGSHADEGRAPTTHYAEGNSIVPAHPRPRNATWPSQLAALSLEAVARHAVHAATEGEDHKAATRHNKGLEEDEDEAAAACAQGPGRTFYFRWPHQNVTISAEARPPVTTPSLPDWNRGVSGGTPHQLRHASSTNVPKRPYTR